MELNQNHQQWLIPKGKLGQLISQIKSVESTGSTNSDLIQQGSDLPDLSVLVADFQSAGKGRSGRQWQAPPKSSLFASVLVKPEAFGPAAYSWLPLMAGLAICKTARDFGVANAAVKWPNDVLVNGNKLSGVLSELLPDLSGVVIGSGVNLTQSKSELPIENATSLAIEGADGVSRDEFLETYLSHLTDLYSDLRDAKGDPESSGLRAAVMTSCSTIGREVRVILPGDKEEFGRAVDIDETGRLIVEKAVGSETFAVAAGDVVHLRHNSL